MTFQPANYLPTYAEKYVLALRCLNAALAIDPDNATVHEQLVRLRQALNTHLDSLPPKAAEVLKSEFTAADSTDLKKYNADFRANHAGSAPHVISAIKTAAFLGEDQDKCARDLADNVLEIPGTHHEQAEEVLGLLRQWRSGGTDEAAEAFKTKAHAKWPEVTAFT